MTGEQILQALPDYVELPGAGIPRIPYYAQNALMQGGFLAGDSKKLQAIVDQVLNIPSGGRLTFRLVTGFVFYSGLYCPFMTSLYPADRAKGYAAESDVAFWILVFGGPSDNIFAWSMRWLPVYLFVDTGLAMASGREVYGFPKSLGTIIRRSDADDDARVAVSTLMYKTYGPNRKAEVDQLFDIGYGSGTSADGLLGSLEDFMGHVVNTIVADAETLVHAGLDLTGLKPPMVGMPMIFLKQFRDSEVQNKACYQAHVEVTIESLKIHDFGPLTDCYQLNFIDSASFPMARDMGLVTGQDLLFPFWLRQDFQLGFGTVI